MAVTVTSFQTQFPEFAGLDTSFVNTWLIQARVEAGNATVWGSCYDMAVSYMLGHLLQKFPSAAGAVASSGGAVTSKSTGGMSIGYGGASVAAGDEGDLAETAYGRAYLRLRRGLRRARVA